jgi:hypothetical protein
MPAFPLGAARRPVHLSDDHEVTPGQRPLKDAFGSLDQPDGALFADPRLTEIRWGEHFTSSTYDELDCEVAYGGPLATGSAGRSGLLKELFRFTP